MALPTLRRGGSPISVRRADSASPANAMSRLDPWNDLRVMDRLFDNFLHNSLSPFERPWAGSVQSSEPQVELYESGEELIAYLYAPGLASDSFDVSASADTITIAAQRKPLLEVTEGLTSHTPWGGLATSSSTFTATYTLPVEIDPAQVKAVYKDGVLNVRMSKSEAAKPRQVKVTVSQQ